MRGQSCSLTLISICLIALIPNAALAYLLPPQTVNPTLSQSHLPEVLIYYSNATSPDTRERDDYEQIIRWLYDTEEPQLIDLAKEFEFDLSHFPLMVDRDLRAIETSLSFANGNLSGIIIASNPLARDGKLRVWKYPSQHFGEIELRLTPSVDPVIRSNPLANQDAFEAVLTQAKSIFDPLKYLFILVIKSHGTANLLMTPRLVTSASLGKERILSIARGQSSLDHPRPGLTKNEFVDTLTRLGTPGMGFSLIFLESCESGSEILNLPNLPTNIGTIVGTDETGAQSNTISYETLFARINHDPSEPPSRLFLDYLNQRARILNPHPAWGRFKFHLLEFTQARGIYFVPLLLFCIYFAWNRSRRLSGG